MGLFLALLLAAPARADLTAPLRDPEMAAAEPAADSASAAFAPLAGVWSGPVRCGGETDSLSLKFDAVDLRHEGRAFIIYTLKGSSYGGYMAGITLTPGAKKGSFLGHDGGGRLPPLLFELKGRVLTGRTAIGGAQGLQNHLEARMTFDALRRSAAVSLRRGDGVSCAGVLARGEGAP